MAKKQNTLLTLLLVAGVAGAGLYFYNKRKQESGADDTAAELPGSADTGGEETATVKAKSKNDIYDAIETAKEIASNTKDAIVTVKDAADQVVAEVTSGNKKGKRKRKISQRKIKLFRARAAKNCEVIKNKRKKAVCKKRKAAAIKWLEAHNIPYNE